MNATLSDIIICLGDRLAEFPCLLSRGTFSSMLSNNKMTALTVMCCCRWTASASCSFGWIHKGGAQCISCAGQVDGQEKENLQPISDKAEGLLAQMPNTRHAKALFSTCGADSRAKLSQSRVMLNGLQPAVVPGHCMKTSEMPKFENTKTLAETPKFISAF